MKIIDNIKKGVRNMFINFLNINQNIEQSISLYKNKTEHIMLNANKLWYQGDADLLNQFYSSIPNQELNFWGVVPTVGMEIPKKHSGIPKVIVNIFADMVSKDLNEITFKNDKQKAEWAKIAKFNSFKKLNNKVLKEALAIGDGAIKIIVNSRFSEPILQFVDGTSVDYEYEFGRISEIIFNQVFHKDFKNYRFEEHYGEGYIKNILLDEDGEEVALSTIPELADYENFVKLNNNFIYAVPVFLLGEDAEYPNRGKSLFSGKHDSFDGLDETISLLETAMREGRVKTYIPESLIPRDPKTGELILHNNSFDNRFIKLAGGMAEGRENKVDVEQPEINTTEYLEAYQLYLQQICLGIIALCSLGIEDDKINNNSLAAKEKEKVTIVTRNQIIETFTEVLKELISKILIIKGTYTDEDDINISFNAYQSPCFESRLSAMNTASQYGSMSTRNIVDELYGDDKDEVFKTNATIMQMMEKGTLNTYNLKIMKELKQIELEDSIYNKILSALQEKEQSELMQGNRFYNNEDATDFTKTEKQSMTKYF